MGRTADQEQSIPYQMASDIESMKKDIERLTKQRKDLGRFLKIDAEKKELVRLKAKGLKITADANGGAMDIIAKAMEDGRVIMAEANAKKDSIEWASEKISKQSKAQLEVMKILNKEYDEKSGKLDIDMIAFAQCRDNFEAKKAKLISRVKAMTKLAAEIG